MAATKLSTGEMYKPKGDPSLFGNPNPIGRSAADIEKSIAEQKEFNRLAQAERSRMDRQKEEQEKWKMREGQKITPSGFSQGFLDYLSQARETKLKEGAANIEQIGAQTRLAGAQTGLTGAQTGKVAAETTRMEQMTPFEIQQMIAQSKLFGAQAGKMEAETASEYGSTAPAMTAMALQRAQAGLMGAQAASELGQTAPSQAQMYSTMAQASKLGEGQYFSRFTPSFMGISPFNVGGSVGQAGLGGQTSYTSLLQPNTSGQMFTAPNKARTKTRYK